MPRFIKILSNQQMKIFDAPPLFTSKQRKQMFETHKWVLETVGNCKSDPNKIGFILQLGYFKAASKFYGIASFRSKDVKYIISKLKLSCKDINLKNYSKTTYKRHKA